MHSLAPHFGRPERTPFTKINLVLNLSCSHDVCLYVTFELRFSDFWNLNFRIFAFLGGPISVVQTSVVRNICFQIFGFWNFGIFGAESQLFTRPLYATFDFRFSDFWIFGFLGGSFSVVQRSVIGLNIFGCLGLS